MVQLDHKKKSYTETLVQFCRALRESGTRISVDESISAATALGEIDPTDKDQFYYALYTSLIDNPEEKNQYTHARGKMYFLLNLYIFNH